MTPHEASSATPKSLFGDFFSFLFWGDFLRAKKCLKQSLNKTGQGLKTQKVKCKAVTTVSVFIAAGTSQSHFFRKAPASTHMCKLQRFPTGHICAYSCPFRIGTDETFFGLREFLLAKYIAINGTTSIRVKTYKFSQTVSLEHFSPRRPPRTKRRVFFWGQRLERGCHAGMKRHYDMHTSWASRWLLARQEPLKAQAHKSQHAVPRGMHVLNMHVRVGQFHPISASHRLLQAMLSLQS